MNNVLKVLLFIFLTNMNFLLAEEPDRTEEKIGQEYIKSSEYPKFSAFGLYGFNKTGIVLGHEGIQGKSPGNFGGGLLFDVPLNKYFAAGASISLTSRNIKKYDPLISRFLFFARPKISFFDRLTIFARFSAGLDVMILQPLVQLSKIESIEERVREVFGTGVRYSMLNPGLNAGATIGIEYFPLPRIGFSVEWGISADIFHIRRGGAEIFDQFIPREGFETPRYYNYVVYDLPLMAMIHIIL